MPARGTQNADRPPVTGMEMLFGERPPIIPFLTAGFPSPSVFVDAAKAVCDAGAGALEIGMPFSDPLADGPVIQYSSQAALDQGIDLPDVLRLTENVGRNVSVPVLLMGYLNPLMQMGFSRFAAAAAGAGVSGTIIPDCPIEEAGPWITASRAAGLSNVFLIAPTTPDERIALIDRRSTVFSYCVSVTGVTGARREITGSTRRYLRRVRRLARKPYVVGFGISKPRHIRDLAGLADGYVVGSALLSTLRESKRTEAAANVGRIVRSLVRATRG